MGRIEDIACQLEANGHDPGALHSLQDELDSLNAVPGMWTRLSQRVADTARTQWAHIVGELQESTEAATIIRRAMTPGEVVSDADADKVRVQLLDLIRVVPAAVIAVTNAAIPIPGTSMVTPWLLNRLGFMPSRWREAYLMDQLTTEVDRLSAAGLSEEATALRSVYTDIEADAQRRERIAIDASILTHWDTNNNGIWDEDERAAYRAAVQGLAKQWSRQGAKKRWFLLHEDTVIGPIRVSDLDTRQQTPTQLVCLDGKSGWVALRHVLSAVEV